MDSYANVTEATSGNIIKNNDLYLKVIFIILTIQGFVLIVSNGAVGLVLMKHQPLRRQYIILSAQIFADTSLGLGFFTAGIGRIIILTIGGFRITRRYCFLSEPMSAVGTLMVSTDRIVSLICPMQYFEKNYAFQIRQIIFYFGSVSLFVLISCIFSLRDNESKLNGFCRSGDILKPLLADITSLVMVTSTTLSVILYIIVYLLSRKHIRRIKSNQTEASLRSFEARQRKLTATMGVSCVCTLIFYVLPMCTKLLAYDDDNDPTTRYSELVRTASGISCNLNPLTNVAAILIKQDDIALRVKQLFSKCIRKPDDRRMSFRIRE
uniref:G-protein coupled receptors family 1 profile domain-containing protein n=1 Tax=Setaria digitata TaxID=48799 RepID=A0A915PXJ5_9BILA